jgi:hypothetical protein
MIFGLTTPAGRTGHVYAALWGLGMAAFGVFGLWLRRRPRWDADRP